MILIIWNILLIMIIHPPCRHAARDECSHAGHMYMCVYIYIYIYICIHTHIERDMYIHVYVCIYIYTHIYIYICIYVAIHTYTHIDDTLRACIVSMHAARQAASGRSRTR